MFELNFKDERYCPFEGAGVISRWSLELPSFKQFDHDTISDVIIHVKYTSVEGVDRLKSAATDSVSTFMQNIVQVGKEEGLFILIESPATL
ncbi:hypothetical protein BH11BAC3_BH11BAC3_12870 [soil metagenome]